MLDNLKAEHAILEQRCHEKTGELQQAQEELKALVGKIVDAPSKKDRAALVSDRGRLVLERDVCTEELQELTARRDAAYLAIYQYQYDQAAGKAAELGEKAREKSAELNALLDERMRFINGGRARLPEAEGDQKHLELESKIGKTQAESTIYSRNARRAGHALEVAENQLDQAQKELTERIKR
jgi:hypothetical protein